MNMENIVYCNRCSLISTYPGIEFQDGQCRFCRLDLPKKLLNNVYKAEAIAEEYEKALPNKHGEYDCMLCLSGGKDSIWMLKRQIDQGKRVLAYTFNNIYEADAAKYNIDQLFSKLNFDHLCFTVKNNKYKSFMKYVFENSPKEYGKELYYQIGKIPCQMCTDFFVLTAIHYADILNIPYILYCADPLQLTTFELDPFLIVERASRYYGETFVKQFYPEWVSKLQNKKEMPKIVYPYALLGKQYDAEKIISELKNQGLYNSNIHATHCKLYPLLEYYTYKHYNASFYTLENAYWSRKNKSLRDSLIAFERQLADFIKVIISSNSDDLHLQEQKNRFIKSLISAQFSEDKAISLVNNLMNMNEIASQLGVTVTKDLS